MLKNKEEETMLTSRIELFDKLVSDINKYSPIVIQGEAGVGKSFFIEQLCRKLVEKGIIQDYTIRKSWDVLDDLICALCYRSMPEWKHDLLSSDIIVIDDFQYLDRKIVIAEELYKIFSSTNAPIIVATSIPINTENIHSKELVEFLNEGTYIKFETPLSDEISEYLKQQVKKSNLHLSPQAYLWLTEQKIYDLTTIKGIIKTLQLYCENEDEYITLVNCKRLVHTLLCTERK